MKKDSWHAEAYTTVLDTDLPDNWCGYVWGWTMRVLLIALITTLLIGYIHGGIAFFTHNFVGQNLSLQCVLGQIWFLLATGVFMAFLYSSWQEANYPMPAWWWKIKTKLCKPIKWED